MLTYAPHFLLAYVFFALAGIWLFLARLFSDDLRNSARAVAVLKTAAWRDKENGKRAYTAKRRNHLLRKYGIFLSIVLFTSLCLAWVYFEENKYELAMGNRLYPANEPVPQIHCPGIDDDTLLLFLGSNGIAFTKAFPRPVIRVRGVDILTIDKNDDGSLAVSALIKREDGTIMAEIKRDEFILAQGHIFKKERLSLSQLRVTDEFGEIVLDLHFFNPRAMWITFNSYGFKFHGSKMQNNQTCLGGHSGAHVPMINMFSPFP